MLCTGWTMTIQQAQQDYMAATHRLRAAQAQYQRAVPHSGSIIRNGETRVLTPTQCRMILALGETKEQFHAAAARYRRTLWGHR